MPLIFLGKHDRIRLDRPMDTEGWIVPENTRIVAGAVIGSHLIRNLGFVLERAKSVQEARWHPQLRTSRCVKPHRDMLSVGWGPLADIHRDIENRAADHANQFALSGRRLLKMQTAHRSFSRRQRLIVLNKGYVCDLCTKPTINPGFRKRSSRVSESPRNKELHVRQIKFTNIHGLSLFLVRGQTVFRPLRIVRNLHTSEDRHQFHYLNFFRC
jgi:hypothetical protein